METIELEQIARTQFLKDVTQPYQWSEEYVYQLLTQAEREACKRASLILDKTTQTSDNVATGTVTSTTTSKLIDTNATFTADMVGYTVYNSTDNTWAVITALDSPTIVSISADIMVSGEAYAIGDASKALTRVCVESGTSEYTLSDKVIKIERCYLSSRGKQYPLKQELQVNSNAVGVPMWYTEEKKLLTLFPTPDATVNSGTGIDTLNLEVYRLPLTDLSGVDGQTPEIDDEYHFDLIHYACYLAYSKQDVDTQDMSKALWHEAQFEKKFGRKMTANEETILRKMPSDFQLGTKSFGI